MAFSGERHRVPPIAMVHSTGPACLAWSRGSYDSKSYFTNRIEFINNIDWDVNRGFEIDGGAEGSSRASKHSQP